MTFGLETIMSVEFQITILRVQVTKRLDREQSERIRKEQLHILEEIRFQAMCAFEQKQRQTKAFVDQHRH